MPYVPNPGRLPDACLMLDEEGHVTGHRAVHVRCFGGFDSRKADHAPWPSAPPTVWAISARPHPYEICEWEIA